MDPADLAKYLPALGVGGILAWGMFQVYRKDVRQMLDAWQGQTALLMKVVQENTKELAEHKAAIQSALSEIRALISVIISSQKEGPK